MAADTPISPYYDEEEIRARVQRGDHRAAVGGLWDELGGLQLEFMIRMGLSTQHRLLDIGCGCLRGGVHFVRYLDPDHYFGTDLNASLLDAGYAEIGIAGLGDRLPRSNLVGDPDFSFQGLRYGFDFAIAFSLFTHLPFNLIRVCLERLSPAIRSGGALYATYFDVAEDRPTWQDAKHHPGGITTHAAADPYHYHGSDFVHAVQSLPWHVHAIGAFGHPRGQQMLEFRRL